MTLIIFIILNVSLAGYFLFYYQKNLAIFEIFGYWCFAIILFQNMSAILYLQFELITLSEIKSYNWADTLNRLILFPLLIVWFLNLYHTAKTTNKVILLFIFLNILVGMEWLSDWVGLFKHNNWQLWWSYVLKLSIISLSIIFMSVFRRKFYRKDRSNEFHI